MTINSIEDERIYTRFAPGKPAHIVRDDQHPAWTVNGILREMARPGHEWTYCGRIVTKGTYMNEEDRVCYRCISAWHAEDDDD